MVHRDVKPANVLLDSETGRAKITDFGLARTVEADTDHLTQHGGAVGTPAYMSPEHILHPQQVDGRSDIYSLGTVLYELLTGERTFAGTTPMILSQTVHEEPRPPRRLNDRVPRDLETICLKCLRKAPANRYATAGDLADDIERFLDGRPITARPVGRRERWVMWCRRNPWTAGLVSSIAVLLVLITVGSLLSAMVIGSAWETEAAARAQAERRSQQAPRAVDEMYTQVAEDWLADQPRLQPLQLQDALVADFPDVPRYRMELASTLNSLASLLQDVGQLAEAEASFRQALEVQAGLAREFPDVPSHHMTLAGIKNNLCGLLVRTGRSAEAQKAYAELISEQQLLADRFPEDVGFQVALAISCNNFGNLQERLGQTEAAEELLRRAAAVYKGLTHRVPGNVFLQRNLAGSISNLCRVLSSHGKQDEADAAFRNVLDQQQQLADEHPGVPDYQAELATTFDNYGTMLHEMGRIADAEPALRAALQIRESLADKYPERLDYQRDLAASQNNLGVFYDGTGQPDLARTPYDEARKLREQLVADHPDEWRFQMELCASYDNLGRHYQRQGKPDEARRWLDLCISRIRTVLEQEPSQRDALQTLASALATRVPSLVSEGLYQEALTDLDEALRLTPEGPRQIGLRADRIRVLLHLKDYDAAVIEALTAARQSEMTAAGVYRLACVLSLVSAELADAAEAERGEQRDQVERLQSRAVQLLEQSCEMGYFQSPDAVEHFESVPDLDALRHREDFEKLRSKLQVGVLESE